ncbi:MAG: MmgE/PrpD family protein [Desulfarculaceae bacterium]|jgi:2-methylcitrate dehydratase PrpD
MNLSQNGNTPDLAAKLLDFVDSVEFADLTPQAVDYCKLLVMDTLGVGLPGSKAPGCKEVVEQFTQLGGTGPSTLLVDGRRLAPPLAALANGTMMHALDFDDTLDVSALHCMVSLLPATLATAEAQGGMDGKSLITALVLGTEIICRVSLAINTPLSWIRSATCGSFGAAAAVAKMLGLDRQKLNDALGIVYAQCAGNAQGLIEGRLIKRMQPGFAAQAGVISGYLARGGITGSRDFLEGTYGYYRLYERDQYDPTPVLEGLGGDLQINHLSIKPYPCCRMTHSAIDGALMLRDSLSDRLDQIEAIEVSASQMVKDMVGKPFEVGENPQVDAQFSIPYTVAAALLRGDIFLSDFEEAAINDSGALDLAAKVNVTADPNLPAKDLMKAKISARLAGGEVMQTKVEAPLGNPAKPMTLDLCREKFYKCLQYSGVSLPASQVDELLAMIQDLENCPDVSRLVGLLCK